MDKVVIRPEIYSFNIDSGAHVSNIAYIQWMEMARLEMLKAIGKPLHEAAKQNIAPVLVSTEIKYKKPLFLGDNVRIDLWISKLAFVSADLAFEFYRNDQELVATGAQTGLFLSQVTQKPHKLSKEERALYERFVAAAG